MNKEQFNSVGSEPALDDWAGRLAALRAQGRTQRGGLALLVEAAVAGATVTPGMLARSLGVRSTRGLGSRRVRDASQKLGSVLAAERVLQYVRRGERDRVLAALVNTLGARFGRRIRLTALRRWRHAVRNHGPAALVDRRGRPRGPRPVDAVLLNDFLMRIGQGETLRASHGATRARAERESRAWPRSVATVRRLLRAGKATVTAPPARGTSKRDYMVKGLYAN